MHDRDSRVEPGQAPHVLIRICCPVPQLNEHVFQLDQALKKNKSFEKILYAGTKNFKHFFVLWTLVDQFYIILKVRKYTFVFKGEVSKLRKWPNCIYKKN